MRESIVWWAEKSYYYSLLSAVFTLPDRNRYRKRLAASKPEFKENTNEAYISAKPPEARSQTRVSCTHVHPCRTVHHQGPAG
jgi:hypothetical protein